MKSEKPPQRAAHDLKIRIFQMGVVIRELDPASMAEAKREYERSSGLVSQYTQLVVDGRELTTSEARKFLKLRKCG